MLPPAPTLVSAASIHPEAFESCTLLYERGLRIPAHFMLSTL